MFDLSDWRHRRKELSCLLARPLFMRHLRWRFPYARRKVSRTCTTHHLVFGFMSKRFVGVIPLYDGDIIDRSWNGQ